jgi:glycosyltransferase involved in cell wall biosynthesis
MKKHSAQPTKIAYIMRSYPVLFHATVFNEIRVLQQMGYEIEVFSLLEVDSGELRRDSITDLPEATYCWRVRQPYLDVIRANLALLSTIGPARYRAAYAFAQAAQILGDLKAFTRFAARAFELKRRGVAHLHAHWATEATTVAMLFSWLTGLPFSFTAHAYDIFLRPQYLDRKLAQASFAVTVSAYNKQFLLDTYGVDFERKIHVIYPLIDLNQFAPRRAPPGGGSLSILSIGRLTEYKGFSYLIEACRVLKERGVKLLCQIVGEGEDRPDLEAAIHRYGLQDSVKLLGSIPHSAVVPLFEKTTVFALPCVIARNGDRDGMPMVLIEAMAREVPVVSSDVIGLRELVRDKVGFLVPPRDPEALADALLQVFQAGAEGQQAMGRAGRRIVEQELDAVWGATRLAALFERSGGAPSGRPQAQTTREATRTTSGVV